MRLDDVQRKYPIGNTVIGRYDFNGTFFPQDVATEPDIQEVFHCYSVEWIPFVRYNCGEFEVWGFGNSKVIGYYTEDCENYYPIILDPDQIMEQYNPDDLYDDRIVITYPTMQEILRIFDRTSYESGFIFTTYEELKDFVKNYLNE